MRLTVGPGVFADADADELRRRDATTVAVMTCGANQDPGGPASGVYTKARDAQSLQAALAQIEKQFGKGSVMRLGEQTQAPVEVIPTGSVAMDVALGIGGLPRGRR